MTPDEQIIAQLIVGGQSSCTLLAAAISWSERAVRRRLRRLVRDGYVFSPERGQYRATLAGRLVMEWGEELATGGSSLWAFDPDNILGPWRPGR